MASFSSENPDRAAIFTTFLNAKGRIMFDAIIVKPLLAKQSETDSDDHVEYWIDVHEGDAL